MASQSMSQNTVQGKSTKHATTMRTWLPVEEQTLINHLKDMVSQGWKCDNGFKMGYLATLEKAMAQSFPGCDLKGEPHIHSKIHVWKKQYGSLSTMLSRSGFGWNEISCTIEVDDEVWAAYIQVTQSF